MARLGGICELLRGLAGGKEHDAGASRAAGTFPVGDATLRGRPWAWGVLCFEIPATSGPHRPEAQDVALSRPKHGFESRWGRHALWYYPIEGQIPRVA